MSAHRGAKQTSSRRADTSGFDTIWTQLIGLRRATSLETSLSPPHPIRRKVGAPMGTLRYGSLADWRGYTSVVAHIRRPGAIRRPDGQITSWFSASSVQPLLQKYSGFPKDQISSISPLSCPSERGVGHRHERWDGMRWTQGALKTKARCCGRRRRVVLAPRCWRKVPEKQFLGSDGGKKARSPGRARYKP
jgi:hypothetical protein